MVLAEISEDLQQRLVFIHQAKAAQEDLEGFLRVKEIAQS